MALLSYEKKSFDHLLQQKSPQLALWPLLSLVCVLVCA